MNHRFFLYGTLRDPELFEVVAGVTFAPRAATLKGARVFWAEGESFPVIVEGGGSAEGVVVEVDDAARERLDFYEIGFGYTVEERVVSTGSGEETAQVYCPEPDRWPAGDAWSLEDWQAGHAALTRLAAREYMGLIGTLSAGEAARAFPTIRSRAASRLRAMEEPSPGIAPDMAGTVVVPEETRQPYTDYFAVREDWLSFPTFGGGKSPVVKRASFMGGDAVTVLPYDADRDTVLMVRQFRHGPFCRGDANPWTLEPAAGRIDPDEEPEETARREMVEETGVEADEVHFIGRYYPSPGAYSEYLYSYVATADLSRRDRSVAGLDHEDEDIMAHVMALDEALALIEDGTINTGPLIQSLYWLALNREKLRG